MTSRRTEYTPSALARLVLDAIERSPNNAVDVFAIRIYVRARLPFFARWRSSLGAILVALATLRAEGLVAARVDGLYELSGEPRRVYSRVFCAWRDQEPS